MNPSELLRASFARGTASKEAEEFRDEKMVENARDARENGYDIVCAECGCAYELKGPTMHESWCPDYDEQAYS